MLYPMWNFVKIKKNNKLEAKKKSLNCLFYEYLNSNFNEFKFQVLFKIWIFLL